MPWDFIEIVDIERELDVDGQTVHVMRSRFTDGTTEVCSTSRFVGLEKGPSEEQQIDVVTKLHGELNVNLVEQEKQRAEEEQAEKLKQEFLIAIRTGADVAAVVAVKAEGIAADLEEAKIAIDEKFAEVIDTKPIDVKPIPIDIGPIDIEPLPIEPIDKVKVK